MRYDKSYLDEVVETQGELFGKVEENIPEIDVADFITKYMTGKTREFIDNGQAYIMTMSPEELWDYFLEVDHFVPKRKGGIGGFAPDWVGRFYAYYQWYYEISSKELVKQIPAEFILAGYRGLHDLDLELAVKKVHEQICKAG